MIEKYVLAQMDIINKKKRIDLLPTLLNQSNQLNLWWWISPPNKFTQKCWGVIRHACG